jgi:hypothetical protein
MFSFVGKWAAKVAAQHPAQKRRFSRILAGLSGRPVSVAWALSKTVLEMIFSFAAKLTDFERTAPC